MSSLEITECRNTVANLVPVHIEYTGEANTSEFFTPTKTVSDDIVTAYFRGLKLVGTTVDLKYDGYVMRKDLIESDPTSLVPLDSSYKAIKKFNQFTVFGHDSKDTSNQWLQVNEWKQVSDILHE